MKVSEAINSVRVVRDFAERPLAAEHEARIKPLEAIVHQERW